MARSHIDINGFKVIEAMPISRVGVFPYLGSQIDYDGSLGLEPKKVYFVFRSPEELFAPDAIESFNGKPFIDNHEMLGKDFTKVDNRPADGTIYNVRPSLDMPEYLIADANIFTEKMIKKIAGGKRELSLGYRCQYVREPGVYNGQVYEFKQTNLRGNHIALVEHGRCGSSVCVCDGALITMDSLPEELNMEANEKKEARLRAKLDACLKGDDEQGCQDALDFLDLPPEERKAALESVKGKKAEPKGAPVADCGNGGDNPTPPAPPPKDEGEAEEDGDGEKTEAAPAATPPPEEGAPVAETPEDGEVAADGCCGKGKKGKKPGTKDECDADGENCEDVNGDGSCNKCGKPVEAKADAPAEKPATEDKCDCCNEGKGGKPCCEDEGGMATTPSIPVPVTKVASLAKDELDALTARIRADYNRAQKLANVVRAETGIAFDSSEMSEVEVARYAAKKIPELAFAADAADEAVLFAVRGHVSKHAAKTAQPTFKVPTADEAIVAKQSGASCYSELREFYK